MTTPITPDDPWRSAPRISRDAFSQLLANSPVAQERDPGEYWDYIVSKGVDPLYILGQFNNESSLGTKGVATKTHSWGNTRNPTFGIDYEPAETPGRTGTFPIFNNWMDGLVTTVSRYLEPTWFYHNRATIREIFVQPLGPDGKPIAPEWAPAGDLNDPAGYLRKVLDYMNAHQEDMGAPQPQPPGGATVATAQWIDGSNVPVPTSDDIGFRVDVDWTDFVGDSRAMGDIQWFIEHDTEGYHAGDLATLHTRAGSTHALVDKDGSLTFMVPLHLTAWTPGNDPVARKSVNVENSGFRDGRDGGYTEQQMQANANFYKWCVAQGMTNVPAVYIGKDDADGGPFPDHNGMLGHEDVPNPNVPGRWGGASGHTDPGPLWDWNGFITLCTGTNPQPGPNGSATYRFFQETQHGIDHGFKSWWEGLQEPMVDAGLPLSEEMQYLGRTTQVFQRAIVQWFPEYQGTKYEFQCLLLGADYAARVMGLSGIGIQQIS